MTLSSHEISLSIPCAGLRTKTTSTFSLLANFNCKTKHVLYAFIWYSIVPGVFLAVGGILSLVFAFTTIFPTQFNSQASLPMLDSATATLMGMALGALSSIWLGHKLRENIRARAQIQASLNSIRGGVGPFMPPNSDGGVGPFVNSDSPLDSNPTPTTPTVRLLVPAIGLVIASSLLVYAVIGLF